MPLLHGSQGCSTYIRRYMISHFKEPVDIASSNFGETTAIFGGKQNLCQGIDNVIRQYHPKLIGIATTCLAETIGDDVSMFLHEFCREHEGRDLPELVHVSTPSYHGTHSEGFHATVRALVEALAEAGPRGRHVNLMPGMVSPADLRYLREIVDDFALPTILLPDYSERLDGPAWDQYHLIPEGGTPLESIRRTGSAQATLQLQSIGASDQTAGAALAKRFEVPNFQLPLPMGVRATDRLFQKLEELSGKETPPRHRGERDRLIDSMVDCHKYVFGKRAVVYGEQDLVVGIAALLAEVGIVPVLCCSGAKTGQLREQLVEACPGMADQIVALEGVDFSDIEEHARSMEPDLVLGNSKGFKFSQTLEIPLIRIGFPIHDRFGGARLLHLGYRGTQQLLDRVVNMLLDVKQTSSGIGYTYF